MGRRMTAEVKTQRAINLTLVVGHRGECRLHVPVKGMRIPGPSGLSAKQADQQQSDNDTMHGHTITSRIDLYPVWRVLKITYFARPMRVPMMDGGIVRMVCVGGQIRR